MTTNIVPTIKRWDTNPDRESLRVIYRFLIQREETENVSLEPHRTHPRLVRATISERDPSAESGILEVHWYETTDFVITYHADQAEDGCPLFRWTYLSDAKSVTWPDHTDDNNIELSYSGSDDAQTVMSPSFKHGSWFHPLQVLPLVIATIEEYAK